MSLFQKTRFNPQTLQNEVLPYKTRDYIWWAVRNVGLILLIGTASIFLFDYAFESPKDRAIPYLYQLQWILIFLQYFHSLYQFAQHSE